MKKGFTLIEIIVCISVLAIIGVGCIVGIRYVNNKIKISKLEQITDEAIQAAQIYIETNKESYNQLYSNQNGVSIPIKLLYDKGLLSIDNTELTIDDLEDEYVVTFLGGSGGSENCERITSSASWANDQPLYLCMNSDGSSNLATIDPDKLNNYNKASREAYYFKGLDPNNYAKFNNLNVRILSIDTDDSITITVNGNNRYQLSNYFNENMRFKINTNETECLIPIKKKCNGNDAWDDNVYCRYQYTSGGFRITQGQYDKTVECVTRINPYSNYELNYEDDRGWIVSDTVYLHLKSCIKIESGTGASDNPFILVSKC